MSEPTQQPSTSQEEPPHHLFETPTVAFDIETVPDPKAVRLYFFAGEKGLDVGKLSDAEVIALAQARLKAERDSDFLPVACHRVLSISCTFRSKDAFKVQSMVDAKDGADEGKVVRQFFSIIEKYQPKLVSWNGASFDLPVLHYRGMIHRVSAPKYWDQGERDKDAKWNNYLSRYHTRHTDLMDLLSLYQARSSARLDVMAKLCGFPGKVGGIDGSKVYDEYKAGNIARIAGYCETDTVNTHLLYVRHLLSSGVITPAAHDAEVAFIRKAIEGLSAQHEHWKEFLAAWA